ncbi:CDP-glycerol glycerophosphotransferase family protein [Jeotgalibacillus haloalkalitolerans]|uniref:CDP-glycerol glycerophosphotransferase family protein n=1 Tax=Jeotgalibacillus haloalkalitolerans TaxID=3104292 RepID=A0ABU5KJD8_9BACL|nr:CDP-glycerol glycerophosphotransferase family protein [Jeotgalibacillus sp. HH7-29]MDZ5711295.1 CDP-glycerol glycerophosphotransferase family protein [Jeotgalibacillus sp. HH7-29]
MSDAIKSIYLVIIYLLFSFYKLRPLQKSAVFYASFEQNTIYILDELLRRNPDIRVTVICKDSIRDKFNHYPEESITLLSLNRQTDLLRRMYHTAVSKVVIVDNYYAELSAMNFKKGVECIQIWHANGAIKSFGLEDRGNIDRTQVAIRRFKSVYKHFTKIVVGSDEMAEVFKRAFGAADEVFLKTGVPRTDLFFDTPVLKSHRREFFRKYPTLEGKKLVLYTPTFRDADDHRYDIDFVSIQQQLGQDYAFIIKMHPATKQILNIPDDPDSIFITVDRTFEVNELLPVADVLITDYSSIPFEFCLLEKPMIFFAYDLEEYIQDRGIWSDYAEFVPGPVVKTTDALVREIQSSHGKPVDPSYQTFCEKWNKYSSGEAGSKLADYILNKI